MSSSVFFQAEDGIQDLWVMGVHTWALPIASGADVSVGLAANPSHLETVGPIVMGMVRAQQDQIDPPGAFSVLPVSRSGADWLTADGRRKVLSFTGSPGVGGRRD